MCKIYLFIVLLLASCSCGVMRPSVGPALPPVVYYDHDHVLTINLNGRVNDENMKAIIDLINGVYDREDIKLVMLELNTEGGSVDAGLLLSKIIERTPKKVVCVVDGEADSMGYYILQSCDVRYMTKRSSLMIHWPRFTYPNFSGESIDYQNVADRLKALQEGMIEHMCRKTAVSNSQMTKKLDGGRQWWVSWREAVKLRMIDEAFDSLSEARKKALSTLP